MVSVRGLVSFAWLDYFHFLDDCLDVSICSSVCSFGYQRHPNPTPNRKQRSPSATFFFEFDFRRWKELKQNQNQLPVLGINASLFLFLCSVPLHVRPGAFWTANNAHQRLASLVLTVNNRHYTYTPYIPTHAGLECHKLALSFSISTWSS